MRFNSSVSNFLFGQCCARDGLALSAGRASAYALLMASRTYVDTVSTYVVLTILGVSTHVVPKCQSMLGQSTDVYHAIVFTYVMLKTEHREWG